LNVNSATFFTVARNDIDSGHISGKGRGECPPVCSIWQQRNTRRHTQAVDFLPYVTLPRQNTPCAVEIQPLNVLVQVCAASGASPAISCQGTTFRGTCVPHFWINAFLHAVGKYCIAFCWSPPSSQPRPAG
jgi:hypothetical protein